ncbi:MAG: hypothetical protein ACREDF_10415 [Thermoplasmata archaeon]
MLNHGEGRARYTVVAAQCVHAPIRANDALTMRFLQRRSTRQEDAALLFGELLRQTKIPPQYADLREILVRGISEKSEYDYKGTEVSRDAAEGKLLRGRAKWLGR